ncbi:hypothetical protein U1Q18_044307, partial [Sarracenia purpurea var. burkii]
MACAGDAADGEALCVIRIILEMLEFLKNIIGLWEIYSGIKHHKAKNSKVIRHLQKIKVTYEEAEVDLGNFIGISQTLQAPKLNWDASPDNFYLFIMF